jgi:hypothetical protein
MSKAQFIEVHQFGEELEKMQIFAKSFDHQIEPMRNGRLYAFERDQRVFGYADVLYIPVAFPAFDPRSTTPRDVLEILQGWKHSCQISHGGDGLIGVPLVEDRKTFPVEMIEKTGFTRMKRELYSLDKLA